jgi:RNA polymerase sigma-70 factor (ECF subfamily)
MTFSKRQIKAAQAGSEAGDFDSLFQENWARICALLFRLVGDWSEAEDLALDVFWRLYRRPPRSNHNLSGWLYRVATNLGFNALRSRRRRREYEEQAGHEALERASPSDPAEVIQRRQTAESVRDTLSLMKPRSASILILRHSGMSYAEIAEALDLAPGSIGTLLARAEREFEANYPQSDDR